MRPVRVHLVIVLVGVAVLAATLGFTGTAGAQTSSSWTQFQGDAAHLGSVATGPGPGYRTGWAVGQETEGPRSAYGLSAPVIGDGIVVATGPTRVVAFDLASGEAAWEIERVLGPSASPAIAQGPDGPVVVFTEGWGDGPPDASETPSATASASASASPDGGSATEPTQPRLLAVPVGGGDPAWSVDLPAVSRSGVTVVGDLAIVPTIDGTVTAVDLSTGQVLWTAEPGGFLETPAAEAGDLVLVSVRGDDDTRTGVVALSLADGERSWRYEPQTGALSTGPPSVGDDAAYVALADGSVRAVSLADGSELWRANLNAYVNPFSPASPPVVAGDAVLVADVRGQLYRLDASTGDRIWDHAYNRPVLRSSPVVVAEHAVLVTSDGGVAAFELATGDLVWEGSVAAPDGGPSVSPLRGLAVGDDVIVVIRGGADAGLAALVNDPDAALIRVASPTILDLPALLLAWAAALAIAAALFVIGRPLWVRLGPTEIPVEDDAEPQEDA